MIPEDFINTAERLLKDTTEEADKRSAISRSYYGAFHASIKSLPPKFAPATADLNGNASHKAVVDALAQWGGSLDSGRTEAQQASRTLATLKKARRRADYDIDDELDAADLSSCVRNARSVLTRVELARSQYEKSTAAIVKEA